MDKLYSVPVVSQEQEEFVRKAVVIINKKAAQFSADNPDKDMSELLMFVALNALVNQMDAVRRRNEAVAEIKTLLSDTDSYLENIKNSR